MAESNMGNQQDVLARMIDVGAKTPTARLAVASGKIWMNQAAMTAIRNRENPKGDVLALAQSAGIMGAKRTSDLLPLCHPLTLDGVSMDCQLASDHVAVRCTVRTTGKTGVEMEALCGVQAALLCIYDMCKIIDPAMRLGDSIVEVKEGGKTGSWRHPDAALPSEASQQQGAAASVLAGCKVAIVVTSDRCHRGQAEDLSGPRLQGLCEQDGAIVTSRVVVPDEMDAIASHCRILADEGQADVVILSGGTGLSPRDVTPQALRQLITYEVPGIGELLRSGGARHTPMSWLSRSLAGVRGKTLFIALPGSRKAVEQGYAAIRGLLPHAAHIMGGGNHDAASSSRERAGHA